MEGLIARVMDRKAAERLSIRKLGDATGVAFSLLAKAAKDPTWQFNRENERKLRAWLGEDVSGIPDDATIRRAEELGRAMARACASEILRIIHEAPRHD
jgi:hypothetical protein